MEKICGRRESVGGLPGLQKEKKHDSTTSTKQRKGEIEPRRRGRGKVITGVSKLARYRYPKGAEVVEKPCQKGTSTY